MARFGLVFPGQGAQYPGMGRELYRGDPAARALFDAAGDALGLDVKALCFEGPQTLLDQTVYTQTCVLTVELAAYEAFAARVGEAPLVLAGHSVGEYAALYAAGAVGRQDVLSLVYRRGRYHQEAVPLGEGAMAALIGPAPAVVEALCREISREGRAVFLSIDNGPGQTVVSGHTAAVTALVEAVRDREGVRAVPLPISVPCHCPLLGPAAARFGEALQGVAFRACRVPVIPNCDPAARHEPERTPELLVRQIVAPVRWRETVEGMAALGVETLVEIGPGRILAGLVRRIDRRLRLLNVEDMASLEKTAAALAASGTA